MAIEITNGQLINKIEGLLERGKITDEVAAILLLEYMHGSLSCLSELKSEVDKLGVQLSKVEEKQDENPSLVWYARHQTKQFMGMLLGLLVLLTYVHDARDVILTWIKDVVSVLF